MCDSINPLIEYAQREAESKLEVESSIESDPFWSDGLRSGVEILHWSKAFEDRLVEI